MAADAPALRNRKTELRRAARARRKCAHAAGAETARTALASTDMGFTGIVGPACISGFHPYQDEIDCTGLMTALCDRGWTGCLPVVVAKDAPLEFRRWAPGDDLVPGLWDIPVPPEAAAVVAPDVLLVPLLAFDRSGFRLGYGGGFYDRTLVRLRARRDIVAVGVAYAEQEMDNVPRGEHDQPLDWILTETGPIAVGAGA